MGQSTKFLPCKLEVTDSKYNKSIKSCCQTNRYLFMFYVSDRMRMLISKRKSDCFSFLWQINAFHFFSKKYFKTQGNVNILRSYMCSFLSRPWILSETPEDSKTGRARHREL